MIEGVGGPLGSLRSRQDTPTYPGHLYLAFSNPNLHGASLTGPIISQALLEQAIMASERAQQRGPLVRLVGGEEDEERELLLLSAWLREERGLRI